MNNIKRLSAGISIVALGICLLSACGQEQTESTVAASIVEEEEEDLLDIAFDFHEGRESESGIWPFDDLAAQGEITSEDTKYIISWEEPQTVGYVRVVWDNMPPEEYYVKYGDVGADTYSLISAYKSGSYLSDVSVDLMDQKCKLVSTDRIMVQTKKAMKIKDVQVYSQNPWQIVWDNLTPTIIEDSDGDQLRELVLDPSGLAILENQLKGGLSSMEIVMAGADLEEVITPNGTMSGSVNNNIVDKTVIVGYRATAGSWSVESPEIEVEVPFRNDRDLEALSGENSTPSIVPDIQEWVGGSGSIRLGDIKRILITKGDSKALDVANILSEDMNSRWKMAIDIVEEESSDISEGDIWLTTVNEDNCRLNGLASEGYVIEADSSVRIIANDYAGLFYGSRSLLRELEKEGGVVCGIIRDYPQYKVRGFGIDVARKRVSLDTLYSILDQMGEFKLNDLNLHLNDNTILNSSNATDLDKTLALYSAFRLESDIVGTVKPITAGDLYYTKEEFKSLVEYARSKGVRIVPEFDTPAHSMAFTSAFPELGQKNAGNADMFDLSNPESQKLVERLWAEYLDGGDKAVFANCDTVHIGGDEYGGDSNLYLDFENNIIDYVEGYGRTARIWGSLSYITGDRNVKSDGVEMMLWSEKWADPLTMYKAGFNLVNCNEGQMYIIPGGSKSRLNTRLVYDGYDVEQYYPGGGKVKLPRYSEQLHGGAYILWNDKGNDESISEQDLIDSFEEALPFVSQKVWRAAKTLAYEELAEFIPNK